MNEQRGTATRTELIVVTGASTGMGRATAERLAGDGFHVLAGVRRPVDADALAAPGIEPVILDITDTQQIDRLAERVRSDSEGRPLRAVVNNAGIAVNAPVEVLALSEWRRQFEVSVFGQVSVTQALLPALIASRGRVVNIGSVGSRVAMPSFGAYSGAKFALDAISDALRRELRGLGVDVVIVTPGAVRTSLTDRGLTAAERATRDMTAEQRSRYGRLMTAYRATVEGFSRDGVEPAVAAAVISRAVRARAPKTRYTVGRDAAFMLWASRLAPDRVLDRMVLGSMKLL